MSITLGIKVTEDVLHDDHWPLFNPETALRLLGHMPGLGVVCFTATKAYDGRGSNDLREACVDTVRPRLFHNPGLAGYRVWLFTEHGWWIPKSRISRYKRMWKSLPQASIEGLRLGEELCLESPEGLRFAGITEVDAASLSTAVNLLTTNWNSALIVSKRDMNTQTELQGICDRALPADRGMPGLSLNWELLSYTLCPQGDIVIRGGWERDNMEAHIYTISLMDMLPIIAEWQRPGSGYPEDE